MKKYKRKHCVRAQPDTAQANTQHYKLHTHENDHRFLFDHGLNGWNGFFKSGFTLVVLEHTLGDVRRRLQRQEFLEWKESFFMPCGQKSFENLFENHWSLTAQK